MKRFFTGFLAMILTVGMLCTGVQAAQTEVKPSVWVMVNGAYDFFGTDLTPYKGKDNVWVDIPIDITKLNSNQENYFSISTNVNSNGNKDDTSVDLYATAYENASGSFLSPERWFGSYVQYGDRQINMKVQVYDNGEWKTLTEDASYQQDNSTVLGQFQGGSWYNAARNIVLGDLSGYTKARIRLNLHVGENIVPLTDDLMYSARVNFWYDVTVSVGSGGTVSGIPAGAVQEKTNVTVVASPEDDYMFAGWYNGEQKVSEKVSYTFEVLGNVSLSARFLEKSHQEQDSYLDYTKYNVEAYTAPFYRDTVVYQESAMIVLNEDGSFPDISLLYPIEEIISVRSSALDVEYTEGKDFSVVDGKLHILPKTSMPYLRYDEMYLDSPVANQSWASADGGYLFSVEGKGFHSRQISITYKHAEVSYDGFVQSYKGDLLPQTMKKLSNKEQIKVAFIGDSITYGLNVSGPINAAPFTPSWAAMTVEALNAVYGQNVTFKNFAVSGTTASWGIEQMDSVVIPSQPDLLVIAFGMNDGAGNVTADIFASELSAMIKKMKDANPDCEILLVSTTLPNPEIPEAYKTQPDYEVAMLELEETGVAVVQMTSTHRDLLKYKNFYDISGSNLNHPNDFLARIYAQSLIAALIEDPVTSTPVGTENQETPAPVSPVIPSRPQTGDTPVLQMLVNEKTWTQLELTPYCGQENAWIEVPLEIKWLREGINQFALDSNVQNSDNLTTQTLDIFATSDSNDVADSFVSTNNMVYWNVMHNRHLNIKLQLSDGKDWYEMRQYVYDHSGGSLVIGKFIPDGLTYLSGRNIEVNDLSAYSQARLLINASVGEELTVSSTYGEEDDGHKREPDAPGSAEFDADSDKAAIRVRVNGNWYGAYIDDYKGKDSVWVPVYLDMGKLKSNEENYFHFSSNVLSHGNFTGSSVDLYATFASENLNSFLTQHPYCDEGWVGYSDRNVNVRLELYDGKKWVAVVPQESAYYDEHTVLGQFANDGNWYNAGRNLVLGDLSGYTDARMLVQLHVGTNLDVPDNYKEEEFATFIKAPDYADNPNTGNNTSWLVALLAIAASGIAVLMFCVRRRKGC